MAEDEQKPVEPPKPEEKPKDKAKKKEKPEKDTASTIHVKLYSPFQVYYDDEAISVSAENDTGPFDILPRHHNFITLLNPCEVVINATAGEKKIKISRGVMHVSRNNVTIFLDV